MTAANPTPAADSGAVTAHGGSGAVTIETTPSGIQIVQVGRVGFFVGTCAAGCTWMLYPSYRTVAWIAQHGENEESVLVFDRSAFDPQAMLDAIEEWVECCHEYEAPR